MHAGHVRQLTLHPSHCATVAAAWSRPCFNTRPPSPGSPEARPSITQCERCGAST